MDTTEMGTNGDEHAVPPVLGFYDGDEIEFLHTEASDADVAVAAPISFALAEATGAAVIVMGFLDLLDETYTVVREAHLSFLAAARGPISSTARLDPGRIDEIRAIVTAGGEVDEPAQADVLDESGRVVARVSMTLAVRQVRH